MLPLYFVRIRHYGFLANLARQEKPTLCGSLLGVDSASEPLPAPEEPVEGQTIRGSMSSLWIAGDHMHIFRRVFSLSLLFNPQPRNTSTRRAPSIRLAALPDGCQYDGTAAASQSPSAMPSRRTKRSNTPAATPRLDRLE